MALQEFLTKHGEESLKDIVDIVANCYVLNREYKTSPTLKTLKKANSDGCSLKDALLRIAGENDENLLVAELEDLMEIVDGYYQHHLEGNI